MEIPLSILFAPIRLFAFNPVACGVVAAALSVPVLLRNFSLSDRMFIGCVALVWWFFAWTEARTNVQTNIRIDLLLQGPIYLALALIAGWRIVRGSVRHKAGARSTPPRESTPSEATHVAASTASKRRFPKWLASPWTISLIVSGALPFVVSGLIQVGSDTAGAAIYEANRLRFEAAFRDDATVARFFGDVRATEGSWAGYYEGDDQDDRFKHLIINADGKTWLYSAKHFYRVGKAEEAVATASEFSTTVANYKDDASLRLPITLRKTQQNQFVFQVPELTANGSARQSLFSKNLPPQFPAASKVGNAVEFVGVFSARYKPEAGKRFSGAQLWLWRAGDRYWGHNLREHFVLGTRYEFLHAAAIDGHCVGRCADGTIVLDAQGKKITLRADASGGFVAQGDAFDPPVLLTPGELVPGFILDLAPVTTVKENKRWLETVNKGSFVKWTVPKP